MSAYDNCPSDGSLQLIASGGTKKWDYAQWATVSPPGITLTHASVSGTEVLVNPAAPKAGLLLQFLWDGGSTAIHNSGTSCCGGMNYGTGLNTALPAGLRWFIVQIVCKKASCQEVPGQVLDVKGIELMAEDDTPPTITPDETTRNIANESNAWVRGSWDASFSADAADGVCQASVSVNGSVVAKSPSYTPDTGSWTQCGAGAGTNGGSGVDDVSHTIDTTGYANGAMSVGYYAADAAQPANVATPVYHLYVDNSPVSLNLSGPTHALSTDGSQVVTASATAGPSGVSGTSCSVDSAPWQWRKGAARQLDVSGLGVNTISCYARNRAVDASGATARSATETWKVDIRRPSVSLISLERVADALRCVRHHVRVHLRAHWITVRVRGHRVRVRVPAETRQITVEHCHPRVKHVLVDRDGRTVVVREVLLPHRVGRSHERIRFGARPKLTGWLGEASGNALGGQSVQILGSPRNGSDRFKLLKTVVTRPNGTWSTRLPRGPSMSVEAVYRGNAQLAPATSTEATITVPASPSLQVTPRDTNWGDTINISGRLRGGYIPSSGELVVLRIGWPGGSDEIGHVYTDRSGRFATNYTFLRGVGSETYRIWAQTVREADYPFATASSRRVRIHVG